MLSTHECLLNKKKKKILYKDYLKYISGSIISLKAFPLKFVPRTLKPNAGI